MAYRLRLSVRRDEVPARALPLLAGSLVAAAAAFSAGWALDLSWADALIAPVSIALLGAAQGVMRWNNRAHRRRAADQWLRYRPAVANPIHRWRAVELTSAHERRVLARSLRGVVDELTGPVRLPGASPLNRVGLLPYAQELSALAARLADLDHPVTPRGVLLVHDLLTDGGSPLYDRTRATDVPESVLAILDALEPR